MLQSEIEEGIWNGPAEHIAAAVSALCQREFTVASFASNERFYKSWQLAHESLRIWLDVQWTIQRAAFSVMAAPHGSGLTWATCHLPYVNRVGLTSDADRGKLYAAIVEHHIHSKVINL